MPAAPTPDALAPRPEGGFTPSQPGVGETPHEGGEPRWRKLGEPDASGAMPPSPGPEALPPREPREYPGREGREGGREGGRDRDRGRGDRGGRDRGGRDRGGRGDRGDRGGDRGDRGERRGDVEGRREAPSAPPAEADATMSQ